MSTDGQGVSTDGQMGSSVAESVPQIADLASSELAAAAEPAKVDRPTGSASNPALAHRVHRPDEVTMESDTHSEGSQTESDKHRAAEIAAASQVVIETLGMPWPKYRTPQCTPINSEYSLSESGFYYGLSACADSCSCCASRWAHGRDGVAQLKVAFTNDFLFDLGAREHKRVTLIRHAESHANQVTSSWASILTCRCCTDPGLIDPPLSPLGSATAQELGLTVSASGFLADNNIELIVVSPLRRALQTAMLLFPPSTHNVPFLITPMHREITDTSGDIGSDPQTLQSEFPEFDFDLRKDWWATDNNNQVHQESPESIRHRILDFSAFLLRRKEYRMVIIGHSAFFAAWTHMSKMKNLEFKTFELCAD